MSARTRAPHYFPNGCEIAIKLCYRAGGHVLLGAQLMGERDTALRIDPVAVAIDRGMTTEELGFADFGYAPPFSAFGTPSPSLATR